jgi:hypothetical protein
MAKIFLFCGVGLFIAEKTHPNLIDWMGSIISKCFIALFFTARSKGIQSAYNLYKKTLNCKHYESY